MVFRENSTTIYRGTVENGVVVLENGTLLPEGTRVRVEPLGKDENVGWAGEDDPVFRMSDLAVDTGLADLASNVDHYLYGHPKANDGKQCVSDTQGWLALLNSADGLHAKRRSSLA